MMTSISEIALKRTARLNYPSTHRQQPHGHEFCSSAGALLILTLLDNGGLSGGALSKAMGVRLEMS